MAIKLGTQTAGIMLVTGDGDLSPIALTDTNPIDPVSRLWSIAFFPDNLASAPTVASATSNPATFTPPAAGEWYVVQLVRTLLVGSTTELLPICVPDPTGVYALPPPGIPADTDPTKTIVNLNSIAKTLGWAGGVVGGVPGLSGAIRKGLTDAATAVANAAAALSQVQGAYLFVATGDNLATAAAAAAGRPLILEAGIHLTAGWAVSQAGLDVRGVGATIKLSGAASNMITVSANDVAFTDIAFDGNSLVTNACIRTTALRTNIVGGSFDHAPKAFALANGAGGGMKDIEIKSATMRPIDIEDCADTCIFDHVHNDALSNASLMVQGAGSATARKFITVTRCDWQTTGDAMILSAQQPTAIEYNAFDTDIQVNPTATWGVERIIANANSFTQSGAVGFYDSGTPGTLTTYAGLFESTEYKAP